MDHSQKLALGAAVGTAATTGVLAEGGKVVGAASGAVGGLLSGIFNAVTLAVEGIATAVEKFFALFLPSSNTDGANKAAADAKKSSEQAKESELNVQKAKSPYKVGSAAVVGAGGVVGAAAVQGNSVLKPASKSTATSPANRLRVNAQGVRYKSAYNTRAQKVPVGAHSWTINLKH
jgi:hypothetical protein